MICDSEGSLCRYHAGHALFTIRFEEKFFEKLDFDAWGKTTKTISVRDKVAALEGHNTTQRPWEALANLMGQAVLRSDTKLCMSQIGICLHAVKSKECYSVQFVCSSCNLATDFMFPVCDDRHLRDHGDRSMLAIFAPYFNLIGRYAPSILPPSPPPPPPLPPQDGHGQVLIAPPPPPPWTGSHKSKLLPPSVAKEEADKGKGERILSTTPTTTGSSDTSSDVVPFHPPTPKPDWKCWWNNGRDQQPTDATAADTGDGDWEWTRRGANNWKSTGDGDWEWTGDGKDDWEWTSTWSYTRFGTNNWQWH